MKSPPANDAYPSIKQTSSVRQHRMHTLRAAATVIAASALAACGGSESNSDTPNLPFTTVAQSGNSAITAPEGAVARSESEFNALWARHAANQSPPPQAPSVDFGTHQVVGYFPGSRPNGCHGMAIVRITQASDRLVVAYKEQVPGAGAICTQQIVNPAHLVALPQSRLPVEFSAE